MFVLNIDVPCSFRFNSYKVAALYSLGFTTEAAELGFYIYETRHSHPK